MPIAAAVNNETLADPVDRIITDALTLRVVVLSGASGTGKTHTAKHAAVSLADAGHVPVWLRCAEYERGRLSVLLARAVAPYTTERPVELLGRAGAAGCQPVLILDGINECPRDHREELPQQQLAAVRLRLPIGVIITTTEPLPLVDDGNATTITTRPTDAGEREALLTSYGAPGLSAAELFDTPLEITLAALCAEDLEASKQFRRVNGHMHLPALRAALERHVAEPLSVPTVMMRT